MQHVGKLETDDFEEIREALSGWDHSYDQIAPGGFSGAMLISQFQQLQASRVIWRNQIRYRGSTPEGTVAMGLSMARRRSGRWLGHDVEPDDIIVQCPDREAEFVGPAEWDAFVLTIPEDTLQRQNAILAGPDHVGKKDLHGVATLTPEGARLLRRQASEYCALMESACSSDGPADALMIDAIPKAAEQVERLFALCVTTPGDIEIRPPSQSRNRAIVREAEAFVKAAPSRTVGILELCEALNVGQRTLYYAFCRAVGHPPGVWLRAIRLNRARNDLRRGKLLPGKVKQVAIENGFFHVGRFSALYQAHFGYLPSQTLHTARR